MPAKRTPKPITREQLVAELGAITAAIGETNGVYDAHLLALLREANCLVARLNPLKPEQPKAAPKARPRRAT